MSLKSGKRLGPYEIESSLGAGGMGEVYRARDTRLDRTVAVKVLPLHLAEHPLAKERFERESRAISALSHPHICALFDVGETEGLTFIVMEHLEGESLADRLDKGPLPVNQVLKFGSQIAEALDRAHRADIVHRDLKPGNVMLTKSGAKLLDFGLAKSTLEAEPQRDSSAPTESRPATEAGTVLGTYQYMAPEQLEGMEADPRADIWALGCLLYEMTTARPAFSGKSQASLISSIMRDVPPPLSDRQPLVSPALEHVVARCLEKEREERWQSAHDVAQELRFLQDTASRTGPTRAVTVVQPGLGRKAWWLAGATALVAAALGTLLGYFLGGADAGEGSGDRIARQLTFQVGEEHAPALSPNGKLLAYVRETEGDADIYVQRVDGRNSLNLTEDSPFSDTSPSFSPDGNQIAFRSERGGGGIFVMGATGESARRLSDRGHDPSWSPDGKRIVVSTEPVVDPLARYGPAELWVIEVDTGEMSRLYAGDAVQPAWSPDGSRIAFWRTVGNSGQRDIATIDAAGLKEPVAVTDDTPADWNPVWSRDGRALYFVSDRAGTMDVWRVGLDPSTGRATREPERVGAPAQQVAWLSVARDEDSLAYVSRSALHFLYRLRLDSNGRATGAAETVYAGSMPLNDAHPSADGDLVALTTAGREDLYLLDVEQAQMRQLTNDSFRDRSPQWSPDGSQIAFQSDRSGSYQLWSIRPDGSGLRQLTDLSDGAWGPYWSPDGSRIAFPTSKATGTCVVTVEDTPASEAECLPNPSETLWFQASDWSPDGLWLVGNPVLRGGAVLPELLVWSFEQSEYWSVEQARAPVARWMPDSQNILMFDEDSRLVRVDRETGSARDVGAVESRGAIRRARLGLARGGRVALVQSASTEANIWLLSPPSGEAGDGS